MQSNAGMVKRQLGLAWLGLAVRDTVSSLKLNKSIVITDRIQKPASLSFYNTASTARCMDSLTFENHVEMT